MNAAGREVQIECGDANVTYDAVADKALEVWRATSGRDALGPAYGFSAQLAPDQEPSSSTLRPPKTPK